MSKTATLYDKTGAAFKLDHEHDGTLYVRPLVKVVTQTNYGDDFHEEEDFEPAAYIVAKAETATLSLGLSVVAGENTRSRAARVLWSDAMQKAISPTDEFCSRTGELARAINPVWPNY